MDKTEQKTKITISNNTLMFALFLLSAIIVFVLCIYTGNKLHVLSSYVYKETEERLLGLSKYLSTQVTAEELAELQTPQDMEKPLFADIRQRLVDFANDNDILYAYYLRGTADGRIQFIADNDLTEDTVNLATDPIDMEEKPMAAFTTGMAATTELGKYSESYDNLISAFAPIFDSAGNIVGLAGIDIGDERILNIRLSMNMLVPMLSAGVLLVALCGFFMMSMHRKTDKARLKALEKALFADEAKSSFLASMSHEMRTPLNAIIGLSDLVLGAKSFGDEERSNITKVSNAGATLLSTVNDILDISKIAAGKLELIIVEYDVPSLLNDAITQSRMHAGDKPIHFALEIDETIPSRLIGDELRIKQICNNLLSNAFKYTREGTVQLIVKSTPGADKMTMITIAVKDTGIGIKPENIKNVFENYEQVDQQANRMIMGTGLGMPITKKLVEMMGGTITVESTYGQGSTFTVQVPQKLVNDVVIGHEVLENLRNFHYTDNKRQIFSTFTRVRLPYAHVLVVDDVGTNLDVAKGLMKPYGMKVDCLVSGQEAVDSVRAARVKYDAIFMDHMMPVMDGIEATRIIREEIGTPYAKTVPIIALTANALVGNEEMFLQKGFNSFLSKPVDIPSLDKALKEFVRNEEKEKLYREQHPNMDEEVSPNETTDSAKSETIQTLVAQQIHGLNVERGLQLLGGDVETYIQVLHSYVTNTPPLLEAAQNLLNLESYRTTVHGVKGSSRGIGASEVGDKAEALEKAAKVGDYDFIVRHNKAFLDEAWELIPKIKDLLTLVDTASSKPVQDKADVNVLKKLAVACKAYDLDEVEAAMDELEKYQYKTDAELVDWLKTNAQLINLQQIIERLSAMPGVVES